MIAALNRPHEFEGNVRGALNSEVSLEEIREGISYGVIKMNIDTDLQFAFTEGARDYILKNHDYLKTQIGNPDGADVPNKKYYDPRKWLREGEITFHERLEQCFSDLNNINTL